MASALIVVDVQNDFCEGGSLAVEGGAAVAARISEHLRGHHYGLVVATRDAHVDPGAHFAAEPDFVDSWPAHCVVGTPGLELHPALDREPIDVVLDKGAHAAAYSGFEAMADGESLAGWLERTGMSEVTVCGLATDHCVRATALDARRLGLPTTVLLDLCAGVAPDTTAAAVGELRSVGVQVR